MAHPEFNSQIGGIRLEGKSEEERVAAIEEIKNLNTELKMLGELDYEFDFDEPITIESDQVENIKISGEDIGNLEQFIIFE